MKIQNIIIRREYKTNEFRTPLIPSDCKKCSEIGITIYVEKSAQRCIPDEDYEKNGCILIEDFTELGLSKSTTLVIGLKELDYFNPKLLPWCHLYFTHIFKNQVGSEEIIAKLESSGAVVYDYEYFLNKKQKRVIAFGFWAGFIGTALGLLQYYYRSIKKDIENLKAYNDSSILFEEVEYFKYFFRKINIGIIGVNGRSGSGSKFLLERLGIQNIHGYSRASNKEPLIQHDIIINCIKLSSEDNEIFISEEKLPTFQKLSVIVDVSCDINARNNPIQLNYHGTTFEDPVYKITDKLDIIAIDNLPSLLPNDSSEEFSAKLRKIICERWDRYLPKLGII
jgi:saccharopine dehydrogenase (NAD+, L-lysine-forming)